MPIPNVPSLSQKLRRGSEGGQEFARILDLLLAADARSNNYPFSSPDDAAGDAFGVDSYVRAGYEDEEHLMAYQYKFFPSPLSSRHRTEIQESLISAQSKFPNLSRWVVITPDDFLKSDAEWFESTMTRRLKRGTFNQRLQIEHWGHTAIVSLMLRFPDVGKRYYPELFESPMGEVVVANLRMDEEHCEWVRVISSSRIVREYFPSFFEYTRYTLPVQFETLEPEAQRIFSDVLSFLCDKMEGRKFPAEARIIFNRLTAKELYDSMMACASVLEETPEQHAIWLAVGKAWPNSEEYQALKATELGPSLATFNKQFMRTRDPVFDITLLNNTTRTEILSRISIEIVDFWSAPKAGPTGAYLLAAMDTYKLRLTVTGVPDIDKRSNALELSRPIVMSAGFPARFRVHFTDFDKSWPPGGINFAKIRFKFHLVESILASEQLLLDF